MYITFLTLITDSQALHFFGRAGGGGSGSSGGGVGGIFFVIGYIPMHFLGAILRKSIPLLVASILGWPLAIIYALFWGLLLGGYGWIVGAVALVGMGAGLYNWFDKISKLSDAAKKKQILALQNDSAWDISALNDQVASTFSRYQADWSNNDSLSMQSYLTPQYLYHNQLMVLALQQINRRNIVGKPVIIKREIIDITDSVDKTQDRFVMLVTARADDDLYDAKTNTLIFRDKKPFKEFWKFIRADDSHWLLDGITQVTEDPYMRNNVIAKFARSHNYCYSPDWGWLLLPTRGQLFDKGKFGTSDINNHVIGVYNNVLIQLYNYTPLPATSPAINYVIAQVALPKTYGNIIVRKKRKISLFGIKGLTRITLEWGDFNKRYEVWASDMERVTSFELLNPSFMVKLQELPFEVNIEVVDNIVYLYSDKIKANEQTYETLLEILHQAFKEMRM